MHLHNPGIGISGGIGAEHIALLNQRINAPHPALKLAIKAAVFALQENALANRTRPISLS